MTDNVQWEITKWGFTGYQKAEEECDVEARHRFDDEVQNELAGTSIAIALAIPIRRRNWSD